MKSFMERSMNPIAMYKKFIDGLVECFCMTERHIREWSDPSPKPYTTPPHFTDLMTELSEKQRQAIADLVHDAYEEGKFEVLRHLSDTIYFDKLRLSIDGEEIPVEPFGMTMYQDWVGRKSGEYIWPDERTETDE
jgi:hypothetical protein